MGIPTYRSNILAEYQLPRLPGVFVNANWQHVGRRPLDDINSAYTPEYDVFDLGVRYTRAVRGRATTWRVTVNNVTNVHYWSHAGPGQHHRPEHGRLSRAPGRTAPAHGVDANRLLSQAYGLLSPCV